MFLNSLSMFFAYSSSPSSLTESIESAVKKFNSFSAELKIKSWREMNIVGAFIATGIQKAIEENDTFIADISILNFNVTYELGYAIGRRKKILLVKNNSIANEEPTISEVGIYDTIGYLEYSNSEELYSFLLNANASPMITEVPKLNIKAPVYLLEQMYKTDYAIRITARIKKARYIYRTFDPNETPRLSAYDAITQVSQSYGILVSLLSKNTNGYKIHNLRAAFIAGLAHGMNKAICILQHNDDPVPLDYRDFVNVYYNTGDIDGHIADFASRVAEKFQDISEPDNPQKITYIQKLDFGSSSAENEMRTLQAYYLKTDAYNRALRGEIQLVVGRKGSGKSAIFLQIRDKERSKGKNVVLDLKPEAYKLIKFKEQLIKYLQAGTFNHTITAFWEYILLLEICHKVIDNDLKRHMNDSDLFEPYRKLNDSYKKEKYLAEGDFSERMSRLMDELESKYRKLFGDSSAKVDLSSSEITNLLYKSDISLLRNDLIEYLKKKDKVWLLLDNIDKGWPSSGLKEEDFLIIRTLIDASRSIQRQFSKEKIEMFPVIFLRNDVYELLVDKTSDRQKEAKELLDWVDYDLLRELIRLRMHSSLQTDYFSFNELWNTIFISHYKGEETSQYLFERSLMRPRFLINLLSQCKSFAVNLNHSKIEAEDIEKGIKSFSSDLLTDISYEMRDVSPKAENLLYRFISSKHEVTFEELLNITQEGVKEGEYSNDLIDLLLWYGFIGIKAINGDVQYIYSVNYNIKILKGLIGKQEGNTKYLINPAFWPSLMIT